MKATLLFALLFVLAVLFAVQQPVSAEPDAFTGTVFYISEDLTQLRAFDVNDPTTDRLIYTVPAGSHGKLNDALLSPNGSMIAFVSSQERYCSVLDNDVFTINVDGGNLRRITTPPKCASLVGKPKGVVNVTVTNSICNGGTEFWVYVEGAAFRKQVFIPCGDTKVVSFDALGADDNRVADFGAGVFQEVTAWRSPDSWLKIGGVDVIPNSTVNTSLQMEAANAIANYAPFDIAWKPDGSEIGFTFGPGMLQKMPVNPLDGQDHQTLLTNNTGQTPADSVVWRPNGTQIVYQNPLNRTLQLATVGTTGNGTAIYTHPDSFGIFRGLDFLNNDQFVFAASSGQFGERTDLFIKTIGGGATTLLQGISPNSSQFILPTASPGGDYVAFTYRETSDGAPQICVVEVADADTNGCWENGGATIKGWTMDWGVISAATPTAVTLDTMGAKSGPARTALSLVACLLPLTGLTLSRVCRRDSGKRNMAIIR